jgi:hypothetical protein
MELQTSVLLTVVRESVSLFILLVFVSFSYRLLDRGLTIFEKHLGDINECLEEIAKVLSAMK